MASDAQLSEVTDSALGRAVSAFEAAIQRLRMLFADGVSPSVEEIHTARVATRRLRVLLRALEFETGEGRASMARDLLGGLARSLGAVRDLDVMTANVRRASNMPDPDPAALRAIFGHLDGARADAVAHLTATVDRFTDGGAPAILVRLHDKGLHSEPTRQWARTIVDRQWRSARTAARRADLASIADAPGEEAAHRIRLRVKRLRYVAEAVAPNLSRARAVARAAADLSDVLGDGRDGAVAARWLCQLSGLHPEVGYTAGRIAERIVSDRRLDATLVDDRWQALAHEVRRAIK